MGYGSSMFPFMLDVGAPGVATPRYCCDCWSRFGLYGCQWTLVRVVGSHEQSSLPRPFFPSSTSIEPEREKEQSPYRSTPSAHVQCKRMATAAATRARLRQLHEKKHSTKKTYIVIQSFLQYSEAVHASGVK